MRTAVQKTLTHRAVQESLARRSTGVTRKVWEIPKRLVWEALSSAMEYASVENTAQRVETCQCGKHCAAQWEMPVWETLRNKMKQTSEEITAYIHPNMMRLSSTE